ncbi:class D sortase [Paenibacillus sp. N3/727]|uniref:class D sortase n=1 Tax=Paenibacillus sp. N3/727 TaxID=2925845 RepID=UPI001F52E937|nr:class D sortase [Paenibacillus sp. N3/727]UNK17569.1 class D sortase [Paenibacillus sp. N3/727]
MKIKITAVLLIVSGIFILFYPTLAEKYHDNQQEKIVREWQNSMQNISNGDEAVEESQKSRISVSNTSTANESESSEDDSESKENASSKLSSYPNAEGILMIEKIDLLQPILHGATQKNLNTTVASVENTGRAGEIGNYAVAGHRNRTYGRNFNRLDEIEKGDKIQVNNGEGLFEYTVTEKLYVKPEEVWVLDPNGKDKEITLITCHPMVNPTHRIIVKGKIEG